MKMNKSLARFFERRPHQILRAFCESEDFWISVDLLVWS